MADMEALNNLFAPPGAILSGDVANELLVIMRLLSLDPQELFYKWESYAIKMGSDSTTMDQKTVQDFKKDLQDAVDRESRAKGHVAQSASKKAVPTPKASGGDVFGILDGMSTAAPGSRTSSASKRKAVNYATPASKSVKNVANSSPSDLRNTAPPTDARTVKFEDRQNAGQIIESLGGDLPAATAPSEAPTEARVKLKAAIELPKLAYKGMAMKLSESSEILDDRIDTFTDLIQAEKDLEDTAFGNPAAQNSAEMVAVGRIACDTPKGKLNAASLVLETSRRMGAGMRIPLQLGKLSYSFFPGQIVALRGTNVSGDYFAVTEILDMPLLPPAASTPDEIDTHNNRLTNSDGEVGSLGMLIASGPYTTDTDLSFAPLHTLLNKAEGQKADVLVLTGPFLDLEHPLIASGDFEDYLPADAKIEPDRATINDVFRILVGQPLQKLVQAVPTITIILVPSMRDIISKHVCWPQDRFPRQLFGLPKQVQVVTNPIALSINELVVGISTQDVLSELQREHVHQSGDGQAFDNDLLARLSNHVIEQRHYFPVFPPQARENLTKPSAIRDEIPEVGGEERLAVGASVDIGYLKLGEWLNVRPDVLVLPSVLSPFAKVVSSVLCINPGTLSKKRGAGTYTALNAQPRKVTDQEREDAELLPHRIFERARVDVTRI